MPKYKNVYMGEDRSTARLPTTGKVNDDMEILLTTFATAYDSVNNIMLTRQTGQFDPTTRREIRGRFSTLKLLCRKYDVSKLRAIEQIEQLALANFDGKISDREYLRRIREVSRKHGLDQNLINLAEQNIDAAERMPPMQRKQQPRDFTAPVKQLFRPHGPTRNNHPVKKTLEREPKLPHASGLWTKNGKRKKTYPGPKEPVLGPAFSPEFKKRERSHGRF